MKRSSDHPSVPAQFDTRRMVLTALFCTLAYLCVFIFRIPVVSFLKYEPKDVMILMGAYLFGPWSGVAISAVVSLLEMFTISTTGPIGMLMNFLSTCIFILPASLCYRKRRNLSGAVAGLILGVLLMTGAMLLWNYWITPLYLGTPREVVKGMLLPVFLPFNLLKGTLNAAVTLLIYKPISRVLKAVGFVSKGETLGGGQGGKHRNLWIALAATVVLLICILCIVLLNR